MSIYKDVEPLVEALETNSLKIEESIYAKGFEGALSTVLGILRALPYANVAEIPEEGIGNLSDGYHTFNELYHHRAILFSVICNSMPDKAWKSKLHDTGDMFDGMFIVGIETPEGQATYHYDIEPYWDMFKVKEIEKAPKWDGHTPQIAIDRIAKLSADVEEVRHGEWKEHCANGYWHYDCPFCDDGYAMKEKDKTPPKYCSNCGADMRGKNNGKE